MNELVKLPAIELLQLHSRILEELRSRDILRGNNNPAGDYAEWLFAKACGWTLERNAQIGFDAVDADGRRIQIKCRRLPSRKTARLLSVIRGLNDRPFDILAAVLLDENYNIYRAALIPIEVVQAKAIYSARVNGHRLLLRDGVWLEPGVVDVTERLKLAQRLAIEEQTTPILNDQSISNQAMLGWLRERRQKLRPKDFDAATAVREERDDF